MGQAKNGDTVKVHYTGKLEDGTVFDSSEGRQPLQFTLGKGNVIPGFENGIMGMDIGDKKDITVAPEDGYGQLRDDLIIDVPAAQVPDNITPELGMQLQVKQPDGQMVNVTIVDVQEEKITLDANHPLAGKTLNFEVTLVEIG